MSTEDRARLEACADRMMQRVRHEVAHLSGDDSECERELVADGGRELAGQVEHLLTLLTDGQREAVADAYGVDGWGELSSMLGEPQLGEEPWEGLDLSTLADAVESETDYFWIDGDVYLTPPCELLEDGEFYLGSDDVSVEMLRDDDGDPAHIRACWGLGGPSVFLTRDWHGDRLGVSWGFDSTVRTGPEVRELLDAYAEMLA